MLSAAGRLLWRGAALLAIALILVELLLRLAASFSGDRERDRESDAAHRIVCVGDSHTYGALVPEEEAYPAQLQRLLDEAAPRTYSVLNLGIPGLSTTQVRDRLRAALERYRPKAVIVWSGVNNAWNRSGEDATRSSWLTRLDAFATLNLRLYRLARVWVQDRALERALERDAAGGRPAIVEHGGKPGSADAVTVVSEGRAEQLGFVRAAMRADREMEERTLRDYQAMVKDARRADARILFIAYPSETDAFAVANRAMRRVLAGSGAPLVDTWKAIQRLPPEQRQMLWAGHPNGAMYGEIARDVLPVVLRPAEGASGKAAGGRRRPGLLAELRFDTGSHSRSGGAPPAAVGACPPLTDACSATGGCFRWKPDGDVCYLQANLATGVPSVRASARVRIDAFPTGPNHYGGYNVLGLFEKFYGTGVYAQLVQPNRLRLFAFGGPGGSCGPLSKPLAPHVWYTLRIRAEKSKSAAISLEVLDERGEPFDAVQCTGQSTGPGDFLHVRIGSGDSGAIASIDFDEIEVHLDIDPAL